MESDDVNDSKTVVEDLAAWLTQIWDEEEATAEGNGILGWLTYRSADGSMQYTTAAAQNEPEDTWVVDGKEVNGYASAQVVYDWRQVLARIAADRKILAWCTERDRIYVGTLASDPSDPANYVPGSLAHPTDSVVLRLLAQAYADRPGFRPEWSVERQGVEW